MMFDRAIKTMLLVSAAGYGLASNVAVAQESPGAQADAANTVPGYRDVDASNVPSGGDIIVTARRVEERLQDVPISITVFNQAQLTQRNVAVAADLAIYTPSLQVNQRYGPEKTSFSIRGFNQDLSTAPTVGVYFVEVVGVRAQGGTTSGNTVGAGAFTDLTNVQVLKGPQGTLFGRNTTGGAVLLTPAKPTGHLGGYMEGTYGNYDQMRLQGAINIPLADTFKVRLAGERNKRDGFIKNLSGIGPHDYNDVDYTYARLSIVADLTPDLENYMIFQYSDSSTNGYASKIIGCATPTSSVGRLNTVQGTPGYSGVRHLQATSCVDQLSRQTARGDDFYTIESGHANPFLDITQWQVINTTTWRASDTITIKNIASYGQFKERTSFELGLSNFAVANVDSSSTPGDTRRGFLLTRINPLLTSTGQVSGTPLFASAGTPYGRTVLDTAAPGVGNSEQSTFTEEMQIQGHTIDQRLNFVIGGYLEFSRPLGFSAGRTANFQSCTRPQDLACANPLLFGTVAESATELSFDNHGIFAQGTFAVTDQLSLTAGARYTFDNITGISTGTRLSYSPGATTGPAFTDPVSGRTPVYRFCTDSFRHRDKRPSLDRSVCMTRLTNSSKEPTWLIGLDFKPTPDLLLYGKYARGYRQGGVNFTSVGVETWQPEKLDSFEVGAKASFRGTVSGYLNVAGFYNNLSDQQVNAVLVPTPAASAVGVAGSVGIVNAGKSRVYGLEVDASALFFESLRFDVGYTYLNTKVKEVESTAAQGDGSRLGTLLVGTPFGTITPSVQVGSPFTNAPKHKLTVTGSYTLPLDESVGRISFGATWVYQSSYVFDGASPQFIDGLPLAFTPSTNLINLNVDWKGIAGSQVDVALFATNLTKEKYNVANLPGWIQNGVAEIVPNQPRFYGVRIRFNLSD